MVLDPTLGLRACWLVFGSTRPGGAGCRSRGPHCCQLQREWRVVARVNPVTGQAWSLGSFVLPTAAVVSNDGKLYVAEWMGSVRCLNLVDGSVRP